MMHTLSRIVLVLLLVVPVTAFARAPQDEPNVNTRYKVARVSIVGIADSRVSQGLRDDMQQLVGRQYDPAAADDLADRLRQELANHTVAVKVTRGDEPEHVNVVFEVTRVYSRRFELAFAPLLYTATDGFSLTLVPSFETHHNYVSFGFTSNADDLLERNTGLLLRYEHRKVGTRKLQLGLEYDYFHPSFQPETETALALHPAVPGVYRTREVFAPSVSVLPIPAIKLTFGASFQTLAMQAPGQGDHAANAFTFAAQLRHVVRSSGHVRHAIAADYTVRKATTGLESDFIYTRQLVAGEYSVEVGRHHAFAGRFQAGSISGDAVLFERFSLGNSSTLRGWDKFDVAPVGGTRVASGSLEYGYRPFRVFYDFGAVWDADREADLHHSVGFGLGWGNGFFVSLGVPLRHERVTPVFVIGIRR